MDQSDISSHCQRLIDLHGSLLQLIDPNDLVLAQLTDHRALDYRVKQRIEIHKLDSQRNSVLLQWLRDSSPQVFDAFLSVLRVTHQEHVANLIDGNPGIMPLPSTVIKHLIVKRVTLCEILITDDTVLAMLRAKEAISRTDVERLRLESTMYDRNGRMLDILERSSERTFRCFLDALTTTYQSDTRMFILQGEIIKLNLRTSLHGDRTNLQGIDIYSYIVQVFTEHLEMHQSSSRHGRTVNSLLNSIYTELEKHELRLVGIRYHLGINVYVYSSTVQSLKALAELIDSKKLSDLFQEAYLRLFVSSFLLTIDIEMNYRPEFDSILRSMLKSSSGPSLLDYIVPSPVSTPSLMLPNTVLKRVLVQVAILKYRSLSKLTPYIVIMTWLAKVSHSWLQVVANRKQFGSRLRDYFDLIKVQSYSMMSPAQLQIGDISTGFYHLERLIQLRRLDLRPVSGLAQLSDRLFVVYRKSIVLCCYLDFPTYRALPTINIPALTDPRDMVGCERTQRLYILDALANGHFTVWQVTASGIADRWLELPTTFSQVMSMSLISDRLLLASESGSLVVYTVQSDSHQPDVSLRLPYVGGMAMVPVQAYETPRGTFITLCRSFSSAKRTRLKQATSYWTDTDYSIERSVEVDHSGTLLSTYSRRCYGYPEYVTFAAGATGQVIVADSASNEVVLLNEKLELQRVLLTRREDGVLSPQRLRYLPNRGHLLVGLGSGHVHVYRLVSD
jgi:hypothetical protein